MQIYKYFEKKSVYFLKIYFSNPFRKTFGWYESSSSGSSRWIWLVNLKVLRNILSLAMPSSGQRQISYNVPRIYWRHFSSLEIIASTALTTDTALIFTPIFSLVPHSVPFLFHFFYSSFLMFLSLGTTKSTTSADFLSTTTVYSWSVLAFLFKWRKLREIFVTLHNSQRDLPSDVGKVISHILSRYFYRCQLLGFTYAISDYVYMYLCLMSDNFRDFYAQFAYRVHFNASNPWSDGFELGAYSWYSLCGNVYNFFQLFVGFLILLLLPP